MPKFSKEELQEINDRTESIEAKREEKRLAREEKQRQKELKRQREFREKLIGPILLILTILITLLLKLLA
jgi:uncharacterized membrane protein (DUF106 family)